jgi:hypothetical protein
MKNISIKLLLIIFAFCFSGNLSAQYKLEKNSSQEFKADPTSTLFIDAQFSELEVLNWDEPIVKTEVSINVSSFDKRIAEDLLKSIEVSVIHEGKNIYIKTILPERLGNRKDTKFEIQISVYTPENINLNLDNKYGAAFIEKINGHAIINSSYGALQIQNLNRGNTLPLNQVNVEYGSATIERANWLKASVEYSKLNLDEANMIAVFSQYSGINLENCKTVASEAKYDTYKLGKIDNYSGNLAYGNMSVSVLNKDFEINAEYSNIKINEVGEDFERIKLDTKNGGSKILINPNASFTFKGAAKSGSINFEDLDVTKQIRENANLILEGKYGKNPAGHIMINAKNGSVKIGLL